MTHGLGTTVLTSPRGPQLLDAEWRVRRWRHRYGRGVQLCAAAGGAESDTQGRAAKQDAGLQGRQLGRGTLEGTTGTPSLPNLRSRATACDATRPPGRDAATAQQCGHQRHCHPAGVSHQQHDGLPAQSACGQAGVADRERESQLLGSGAHGHWAAAAGVPSQLPLGVAD